MPTRLFNLKYVLVISNELRQIHDRHALSNMEAALITMTGSICNIHRVTPVRDGWLEGTK